MQIWCSTYRPNLLKAFDADTCAIVFAYNELNQAISVVLTVDNQVSVCVSAVMCTCVYCTFVYVRVCVVCVYALVSMYSGAVNLPIS